LTRPAFQAYGEGPPVLLIHGTAADSSTWAMQVRSLAAHCQLLTWNRQAHDSVEAHVADALALLREVFGKPCVGVGSSFGGVVALELARRHPEWLSGLLLLEPPLRPNDDESAVPDWFSTRFDALLREGRGEEAAEYFLRTVLGDAAFERMPKAYQQKSLSLWRNIQHDTLALKAYRVHYAQLKNIEVPTLLLGGENSAPFYRPTLEALEQALGNASLEFVPNAGHMMHAEAHRAFNARLLDFLRSVSLPSA